MRVPCLTLVLVLSACGDTARMAPSETVVAQAAARDAREHGASASDAVDFEHFALGAIDGQLDWQSFGGQGAVPGRACAVYDHEISGPLDRRAGSASELFGERSLRISNAVTSGCYSDQTFSSRSADVAGQAGAVSRSRDGLTDYALPGAALRNHLDAEWIIQSTQPSAQQPGLEMVVSPARGDDHRMSWLRMADRADGLELAFAERADPSSPGAFQIATVARDLDRRAPHRIRLSLDFVDGPANDVVRVYVDGVLRHVGTSWETYYALDEHGRANFGGSPPAVNRLMFRTGSDSYRGVPGDAAPSLLGKGFLIDQVRVVAYAAPRSRNDCLREGWRDVRDDFGAAFKNQGSCVSAVVREGGVRPIVER